MQNTLPFKKLSKNEIKRIAHAFIREQYGSIPSIGEPINEESIWKVPINANYPRILFNDRQQKPEKVRFMRFENLLMIEIDEYGKILSKPKFYEIFGEVQSNLKKIKESIEKALIKIAADKFSNLTFPDHMFTPIQDILSYILVEDCLKLSEFLSTSPIDKHEKIIQNMDLLESVGLVRRENDLILPSNILIEIEMKENLSTPEKLSAALTIFYKKGYEHLDTITSFLGPHLILSGYAFRESLEMDQIIPITEREFKEIIKDSDRSKISKVPRYLLQLESIGILVPNKFHKNSWEPNPVLFEQLKSDEELIEPLKNMIIN